MQPDRPVARDRPSDDAWPLVAARRISDHDARPGRAPVTHSYAALAFHIGGRSRLEQNGVWDVGEGDLVVVPPGAPHRMLEADRPAYWGLSFCVPCFAAHGAAALLEPFERVRDGASAIVHIPAERRAYLEGLFREVEDLGRAPRDPIDTLEAVQRSLLTLILAEVDRAAGPDDARRGIGRAVGGGVVTEALRFIERNCLGPLTVADVATAVGRTSTHVTAALTRATGRSAGKWILSGRMAEARRLLLHSDERVDVIAERVGYADATHFIRMFRREHGATPAAWRAGIAHRVRGE